LQKRRQEKPSDETRHRYMKTEEKKKHHMNKKPLLILLFAVTVLAFGCKKEPSTSEKIDKIKEDTQEVAKDMKDYTFAQKNEFVKKMKTQLKGVGEELDQLSAKIEKADDKVKADANPKIQALRDQADELNKKIDKVQDANESTWDNVKAGTREAFDSFKDGVESSREWLSEKIKP